MTRIDAHHHLWDTGRRDYDWMDGDWADPLRGRFDVARLAAETKAGGVTATVVVQALTDEAETRELLEIAAAEPLVAAVVGWTDLTAPDVADRLAGLRAAPGGTALAGIRHPAQDLPDSAWLVREDALNGIAAVGAAGLVYELLVKPPELAAAVEAVRRLPEVPFVLDHIAKPEIAAGGWEPWASLITEAAAAPNLTVKMSGIVTEADWTDWKIKTLLPYARHVLNVFGPDRVMFGSDWPVCTLAAPYGTVMELAEVIFEELSETERAAVFSGTAGRVYGISAGQ